MFKYYDDILSSEDKIFRILEELDAELSNLELNKIKFIEVIQKQNPNLAMTIQKIFDAQHVNIDLDKLQTRLNTKYTLEKNNILLL